MLLVPLILGAGAVGVYYLTRKNRGKKHSSRRHRSSRRSTGLKGGWGWRSVVRPMGQPSIGKDSTKPPGLKGGGLGWLRNQWPKSMGPEPRPMGPEPRPMGPAVGTNGSGIIPRFFMGGKKSRKHRKH
jgi:hypothetical protein